MLVRLHSGDEHIVCRAGRVGPLVDMVVLGDLSGKSTEACLGGVVHAIELPCRPEEGRMIPCKMLTGSTLHRFSIQMARLNPSVSSKNGSNSVAATNSAQASKPQSGIDSAFGQEAPKKSANRAPRSSKAKPQPHNCSLQAGPLNPGQHTRPYQTEDVNIRELSDLFSKFPNES